MKSILDWRDGHPLELLTAVEGGVRSTGRVVGFVVQYSLLALVLVVWSVVGFFFWIPLIARATVAFCVTAIYSNLVAHDTEVPNRGLQHAAFFYLNGFGSIHRAIVGLQSDEPKKTPDFQIERFFTESLWTIVCWWITLIALAYFGLGFSQYLEQLVYPVTWTIREASATWAWLSLEVDTLLRGAGF